MEDRTKYAIAAGGAAAAAAAGVAYYYRREIGASLPSLPSLPGLPTSASYADRLLGVVYELLPDPASTLQEPDERWDWALGGKTGTKDIWGYYQWATGAKYGTTCGIFAAACMSRAGWPRELINRKEPEGSGYKPTWHIARIHEGAVKLGWLWNWEKDRPVPLTVAARAMRVLRGEWSGPDSTSPALSGAGGAATGSNWIWTAGGAFGSALLGATPLGATDEPPLQPGDVYCQTRDYVDSKCVKRRNEHVGIILTVDRDGDAWRVETADGGQTSPKTGRQMAARVRRRLRGSTFTNLQNGAVGDMRWIVRSKGNPK